MQTLGTGLIVRLRHLVIVTSSLDYVYSKPKMEPKPSEPVTSLNTQELFFRKVTYSIYDVSSDIF
jgi:hypothetical protein